MEIVNAENSVIESLQKENADLKDSNAELQSDIEAGKQLLIEANEKNATLTAELAAAKHDLESAHIVNAELSKEIESLTVKAEKKPTETCFEKDGILYGFHYHKTILNGQLVTSKDVAASEALQSELVSISSGMIYSKGND